MNTAPLLPPFPAGWYAVALSREVPIGAVQPLKFMGQDVVLFRTRSGVPCLVDAYCPHLGAHFGYGGRVDGECLQCPFHGFRFDTQGRCVDTPYGTKVPPKANARLWPLIEVHGLLLAYSGSPDHPPAWTVPALDTRGWSGLYAKRWQFRGHPQETTENSVDIGHFGTIHHYTHVDMLKEFRTDGPYLTVKYAMTRDRAVLGRPVRAEFEIHAYGLGYSLVEVSVPQFGARSRLFVLATPLDGETLTLRVALSHDQNSALPTGSPLAVVPRTILNALMARSTFNGFVHDVSQDFNIWQHKRYVQPPILAEGDGPVGKFRQWAKQFYRGAEQTLI